MLKRDELSRTDSCLNRADEDERVFVLLARDPAAPTAIRAWIRERLRLDENAPDDLQVVEASACADAMDVERSDVLARLAEHVHVRCDTAGDVTTVVVTLSRGDRRATASFTVTSSQLTSPDAGVTWCHRRDDAVVRARVQLNAEQG